MHFRDVNRLIQKCADDPLGLLRACGGYYECPRGQNGERLGPLVGYAGEYEPGKHWVGDVYANYAKAERRPQVFAYMAQQLSLAISEWQRLATNATKIDVFCGMPLGGMALAYELARQRECDYIYLEKKTKKSGDAGQRDEADLVFGRHEVEPGDKVVIVEDVANNFSTADLAIEVILRSQAEVVAIVCLLNRSLAVDDKYVFARPPQAITLPVISLTRKKIMQWRQDDPEVLDDTFRGNVVWKPKDRTSWLKLEQAMVQHGKS